MDADIILGHAVDRHRPHTLEDTYSVGGVNDVVAVVQFVEGVNGVLVFLVSGLAANSHLPVCKEGEFGRWKFHSCAQGAAGNGERACTKSLAAVSNKFRPYSVAAQVVGEVFGRLFGACKHRYAETALDKGQSILFQLLKGAVPHRKLSQGEVDGAFDLHSVVASGKGVEKDGSLSLKAGLKLAFCEGKAVQPLAEMSAFKQALYLL